jgi:hypothetical protein
MKTFCHVIGNAALLAVFSLTPTLAKAQEMILHLPLDSIGESGSFVVKDNGAAAPERVSGKVGQAMHFQGNSAVALPFDFNFKLYPQVTVTAWVKQDVGASNSRAILSSASGRGVMLSVSGGRAALVPGSGGLSYPAPMPYDEWIFVAGVVDMSARTAMLYQGGGAAVVKDGIAVSNDDATTYKHPNDPDAPKQPFMIVGAGKFLPWLNAERAMAIDDVRVYRGALSQEEIDAIRTSANRVVIPGPAEQIRDSVDENRPGTVGPVTTRSGELGQDTAIPDAKGQIDRSVIDARSIGETEKNDTGAVESTASGTPSTQEKPYTTDNPTTTTGGASESTGTNVSTPTGKVAIPGAAEQIAKSADDALPDAPRPAVTAPTGKVAIPGAAEQIAKSQDETLPEGDATPTTEDAGTVTRQQGLTPEETGGELYAIGDISEAKFSAIAGFEGDITHKLDLGEFFLRRIGWSDRGDVPCSVRVSSESDNSESNKSEGAEFGCPATFAVKMPYSDFEVGFEDSVINSLDVCSGLSSKRLKGIRIAGDHINPDGTLTYIGAIDSESLARCGRWSGVKLCPDNYVGTGLIVHTNDRRGNDKEQVVGLQLICRTIAVR